MPVKIRLQRRGRKKAPFYHIVIADSRAPRDGRFIEKIGTYNPMTKPATIDLDRDAAFDWLQKGAQPTDTVRAMLRFKGVLYRTHLQRGVKKGALTQEQADSKYQEWIEAKDAKTQARFEQTAQEKQALMAKIAGNPPAPKPAEETAEEAHRPTEEDNRTLAEQLSENVLDAVTGAAETVQEKVAEVVETAKELAQETVDAAKETIAEATEGNEADTPADETENKDA